MNEHNNTSPEGGDSPETSGRNRRKKVGRVMGAVAAGAGGLLAFNVPTLVGVVGPHLANNAEHGAEQPRFGFNDCDWSDEILDAIPASEVTKEGAYAETTGKERVVILELDKNNQDSILSPNAVTFTHPEDPDTEHTTTQTGIFTEGTIDDRLAVRVFDEHGATFALTAFDSETGESEVFPTKVIEVDEFTPDELAVIDDSC